MKKLVGILIMIALLAGINAGYADPYEKPILFRGVEWGASCAAFENGVFPDGLQFYNAKLLDSWHSVANMLYDGADIRYKGEFGFYYRPLPSSIKKLGLKVAGYPVDDLYLYFTFLPGDDGILVKDTIHSSFIYVYYKIEPNDPEGTYSDLLNKLTALYGDVDYSTAKSPYISYTYNLWNGADGTMVCLEKEDYPSGSHYIYIKYSFAGADDIIKTAYDAFVFEETRNAASDTSGL